MLLISSATTSCSCHTKVSVHGGFKSSHPSWKLFDMDCNNTDIASVKAYNGVGNFRAPSLRRRQPSCLYSVCNESSKGCLSVSKLVPFYETGSGLHKYPLAVIDDSGFNQLKGFASEKIDAPDFFPNSSFTVSSASSGQDIVSVAQDFFESISLSVKATFAGANEAVDNVIHDVALFFNRSGESAGNKLIGLGGDFKEASGRAELAALDVLRGAIAFVEGFLGQGREAVVYSYSYAKQLLPPELQDAFRSSEDILGRVLHPLETALQQAYLSLEGVEETVGLDPNDPLIRFTLFLGLTAILWGTYRVLVYGGYSGDLSPRSTLELLQGNENVVLVDIRPEDVRERDGIPDLRRKARYRYASVAVPEVDGSVRKLLKGGRELEDSLLAVVICNLKIADDRTKVLVLDSDGSRSKGVARSLRQLGIQRPYLVQGGFQCWVEEGFRIKMPKPETFLTVLNEETEAIIEEIKPTPLKLAAYGLGAAAAAYSLIEWETTLQLVGIIGLSQSIYRRVASYEDSEDFKQDVSLLLSPVRLGVEAISRATGKAENGRNGLPMSPPSSSDVQSRVLQAAAKHESQPEESQDSSINETVNVSEA